ncbi:MAG TPA: twin-arginine translocation signal domain-containing protein, partial [Gemmatimonadales bacterium]|nr:twin-arginine translocation signal domain-containing protein [Gemmatimonadales bacterium]
MSDRRGFVGTVAALGAGAVLRPFSTSELAVSPSPTPASDAWLDQLKGKHRHLFDVPEPDGGTGLRHVRTYLDAWREAFGVAERDVSVVVTLYARTTPWGLHDTMWAKYRLGAA